MNIQIKGNTLSVNRLYQGRRFLTREGKDYKESVAWEARNQFRSDPLSGEIHLSIDFYFKDKRRRDIDNGLKAILDSLTGVLWLDDSQIVKIIVTKNVDPANPRIDISFTSV